MASRKIIEEPNAALRKKSRPVTNITDRTRQLLDDMAETLYENDGVGLAAPQVGILRRVVVIDIGEGLIELINPEIVSYCESQVGLEGCLSVPGVNDYIERPNKIVVRAQNRAGERIELSGEGLLARALCHEIDHLDGKLFIDLPRAEPPQETRAEEAKD
ncbi:MAG: peptide deformylase [Christensenellales bacterium]